MNSVNFIIWQTGYSELLIWQIGLFPTKQLSGELSGTLIPTHTHCRALIWKWGPRWHEPWVCIWGTWRDPAVPLLLWQPGSLCFVTVAHHSYAQHPWQGPPPLLCFPCVTSGTAYGWVASRCSRCEGPLQLVTSPLFHFSQLICNGALRMIPVVSVKNHFSLLSVQGLSFLSPHICFLSTWECSCNKVVKVSP